MGIPIGKIAKIGMVAASAFGVDLDDADNKALKRTNQLLEKLVQQQAATNMILLQTLEKVEPQVYRALMRDLGDDE